MAAACQVIVCRSYIITYRICPVAVPKTGVIRICAKSHTHTRAHLLICVHTHRVHNRASSNERHLTPVRVHRPRGSDWNASAHPLRRVRVCLAAFMLHSMMSLTPAKQLNSVVGRGEDSPARIPAARSLADTAHRPFIALRSQRFFGEQEARVRVHKGPQTRGRACIVGAWLVNVFGRNVWACSAVCACVVCGLLHLRFGACELGDVRCVFSNSLRGHCALCGIGRTMRISSYFMRCILRISFLAN